MDGLILALLGISIALSTLSCVLSLAKTRNRKEES
jgi:hypothetical protein